MSNAHNLARKIEALTEEQVAQVESFVDALQSRGPQETMSRTAAALSEPAFEKVWNNPEDDVYDAL
jgi:hypothetical protein